MRPEIYSSLLLVVTLRRERGRDPGRGDRGDLRQAGGAGRDCPLPWAHCDGAKSRLIRRVRPENLRVQQGMILSIRDHNHLIVWLQDKVGAFPLEYSRVNAQNFFEF
jgi:hypothetical protein